MAKSLIDLNSQELYQIIKKRINNQLEEIKTQKYRNNQEYMYTQEEIFCSKKFISFDHNNINEWMSATFGTDVNRKKILSPKIKDSWGPCQIDQKRYGTEIKDKIFCSKDYINYKIINNNIKSTFILKGESDFWVFLHTKGKLEDETVVILFSKYQFSQIVFMSLGLFIKNDDVTMGEDKKYFFRIFQTLQLVETYEKNKKDYIMNTKYESADSCLIKLNIIDNGSEKIQVSAWINEGSAENKLIGNFCYPVNIIKENDLKNSAFDRIAEDYVIMFAGSGDSCEINRFSCETEFKEDYDYFAGCKQGLHGCNCCKIF